MPVKPEIVEIEAKIFTPALQKAMQQAMDNGNTLNDAILGAANAYINMLVELRGKPEAIEMIDSQLEFLKNS